MNINIADWNNDKNIAGNRNKETLEYMINNNVNFIGFQGFAKTEVDLSELVPEQFPKSVLFVFDENGEIIEERRQTFNEYFATIFNHNLTDEKLIFLSSFKNLCLNYIRDRKQKKENHFIELENENLYAEDFSKKIEGSEILTLIEKAIEELEFEEREVIILREFEGHSYNEISELLNIPIGSVMSRLFYARKKLAEKLRTKI